MAFFQPNENTCGKIIFLFLIPFPPSSRNLNVQITFLGMGETLPPLPFFCFLCAEGESLMEGRNKTRENEMNKQSTSGGREGILFFLKHYLQETTSIFQTAEVFLPTVCWSVLLHRDQRQLIPLSSWSWPQLSQPSMDHFCAVEEVS